MQWWVQLSEIVRNLGILVGGAVGIYLAWLRVMAANQQAEAATRQADLNRRSHVAELFNQAVGQLQNDKLEIRLGAIYTLHQIAEDFPDLTTAVYELLTAYIRENPKPWGETEPPADIREIFRILNKALRNSK